MGERNKECAVGIDLGTSNSRVAVWRQQGSRVEILTNRCGKMNTASVVAFTDQNVFIGAPALDQATANAENTIFHAKRLIGKKYSDPKIDKDFETWPFKVGADDGYDKPRFVVKQGEYKFKLFSAEKISSMILKDIWKDLKRQGKKAVIAVPVKFSKSQREAIKNVGKNAGLDILAIIDEPVAAAISYGHEKRANSVEKRNIFVLDLGGGYFNVALVTVKDNFFKVIAKDGNNHLGGEDFTNKMLNHFIKLFNSKNKIDIRKDPRALSRLRYACEKAKMKLSVENSAVVKVDSLSKGIHLSESITRAKFEELNAELFKECMKIAKRCLADAKIKDKSNVHDVVLLGGSSRIPKVKQLLQEFFPPEKIHTSIREEAVVKGAALLAALLSNNIMNVPNLVLSNLNPLSLGVDGSGGAMKVIIPRNAAIPVTKKPVKFSTVYDGQGSIEFHVYEGERVRASKNNLLGSLKLSGLPPKAHGGYDVYITFSIDRNGTLSVSLEDRKSNRNFDIEITKDKRKSSSKEITEMIREAKIHEAEDAAHVNRAKAKRNLRRYVDGMEKALKDKNMNSKLRTEDKDKIKRVIDKAKKVIDVDIHKQAFEDCLKEAKSVFEPIKQKIG